MHLLLKNDDQILPLRPESLKSVAVIGRFAKTPRYQGGGSSHVNPTKLECAWDELQTLLGQAVQLRYADGYPEEDRVDESVLDEAVEAAKAADVAVLFIGLPDAYEVEGMDRQHIHLPPSHDRLVEEVSACSPTRSWCFPTAAPWPCPGSTAPKRSSKAGSADKPQAAPSLTSWWAK